MVQAPFVVINIKRCCHNEICEVVEPRHVERKLRTKKFCCANKELRKLKSSGDRVDKAISPKTGKDVKRKETFFPET